MAPRESDEHDEQVLARLAERLQPALVAVVSEITAGAATRKHGRDLMGAVLHSDAAETMRGRPGAAILVGRRERRTSSHTGQCQERPHEETRDMRSSQSN